MNYLLILNSVAKVRAIFSARLLFAVVACCLCFGAPTFAQEEAFDNWDRRWDHGLGLEAWMFLHDGETKTTEAEAAEARIRWQRLAAGVASSGDEWAGDYSIGGDVFLNVIRWTPEGGYVRFSTNLCTATVKTIDYGDVVSSSPSHIEIVSAKGNVSSEKRKLVKVKWGEQRYLVGEDEVRAFCDYVVGRDTLDGAGGVGAMFFMHRDDDEKPTAVLPTVPPEYREHVRRPIEARIIKVGKSYVEVNPENEWYNNLVTPVTINIGSDQGIKRSMMIPILDSDDINEAVEITRVNANNSRGIIVRSMRKRPGVKINEWDDGTNVPQQQIVVGWRLTTSVHKQMLRSDARSTAWEAKQPKR